MRAVLFFAGAVMVGLWLLAIGQLMAVAAVVFGLN